MLRRDFPEAAKDSGQIAWRFQEILQTSPDNIVRQLVGHDRVHVSGARDLEEIRRCRLGGDGFDRTCYALIAPDSTVHSAIYVYKTYAPVRHDTDYHGNIADILACETTPDNRDPQAFIFYSISNITDARGAGQALVNDLHTHLSREYPTAGRSTLSPLRDFGVGFSDEDKAIFAAMTPEQQTYRVLSHLYSAKNSVQNFHLGNGARIADINLNAGDISYDEQSGEPSRHDVMVNYAYDMPADKLAANAHRYRGVKAALRDKTMDSALREMTVRDGVISVVSPSILSRVADAICMPSPKIA